MGKVKKMLCEDCYPGQFTWLHVESESEEDDTKSDKKKKKKKKKNKEPESSSDDEDLGQGGGDQQMLSLLFKLQMETMHGLVKTVYIRNNDRPSEVQFLYMTNKQALSVSQENMHKVCEELDLGKPSLVIRLMPCQLSGEWWKAFPYFAAGRFPEKRTPETPDEEELTEHQLLLLAKEVILPLCTAGVQTLVIGQAACSMTSAFLQVSTQIQHQFRELGKPCPFRVLMLCSAPFFELKASDETSLAYNFKKASKRWQLKTDCFQTALDKRYGNDEAYWPRVDLFQGQYSVIMFECLGPDGMLNEKAMMGFQHYFITSLMDDVPVLGLQTYGTDRMSFMPAVADHVGRGMPLMLIDSRRHENPEVHSVEEAEVQLKALSEKLHAAGVADWYCTSALALMKTAVDNFREELDKGESAHVEQRQMWIFKAILTARKELARKKKDKQNKSAAVKEPKKSKKDKTKVLQQPEDADVLEERQLVKGTNTLMSYVGKEIEWEMTVRHARFQEGVENIEKAQTWQDLRDEVENNWLKIRGCAFHLHKAMKAFVDKHDWCEWHDEGPKPVPRWRMGRHRLKINLAKVANTKDKAFFQEAKSAVVGLFNAEFSISSGMDKNRLTQRAFTSSDDLWMAVYETLKSGDVATASLHDLQDCRRKLSQLAVLDYLPNENSLEALVLLRRAWTLFELYTSQAKVYRIHAKIAYFWLLTLEVLITIIVTSRNFFVQDEEDGNVPELVKTLIFHPRVLMALALLSSLISGYQALMAPNRKFTRLRSAAFKMESEIWKFRTRMGEYRLKDAALIGVKQADRENEAAFSKNLETIEEAVRTSAGMGRTHFYSKATTIPDTLADPAFDDKGGFLSNMRARFNMKCKHNQYDMGQRPPKRFTDNHHSPESPESYIAMRMFPARDKVQKNIPRMVRVHMLFQAVLMISATMTALLAATTDGTVNAMIASLCGAIAAWQEFTGVENRLDKFSEVAEKLEQLVTWWQSLPDEEKRVVKNAETLVLEAENEICNQVPAMTNATSVQSQKKE